MVINAPTTASSYGHQYRLDKDDIQKVCNKQNLQEQKLHLFKLSIQ